MNSFEKRIIKKLIHAKNSSFNELWGKKGESNNFSYHLGKIVEKGLVEKKEGKYSLTEEGHKMSAFVEGDTGERAEFPTITIVLIVKKGNKFLCQKRLKQPFYGVWGFPSGKINFGQNLFECAKRDLEEETGLKSSEWKLKALEQVKTFEDKKMLFHHYIFHLMTEQAKGKLKEKTHKAENKWMTIDEYYSKEEAFPGDKFKEHILPAEKPIMIEAERYLKNGKFAGYKTLSVSKF